MPASNTFMHKTEEMQTSRLSLILFVSIFFLSTCGSDEDWLIVCDSCPSSTPWSVWSIDLRHPCFETKAECEAWAEGTLPVGWECEKCDG